MGRIFIVYTESEEQLRIENGRLELPASESMALEFTSPQYVEKALLLFPNENDV